MVDKNDPVLVFTAHDRCDRCGAQAYTLVHHDDLPGELLFCVHHIREVGDKLLSDGWEIIGDAEAIEDLVNV